MRFVVQSLPMAARSRIRLLLFIDTPILKKSTSHEPDGVGVHRLTLSP
jgi:hypothetical protein